MKKKTKKMKERKITEKDLIWHLAGMVAYLKNEECENSGDNWLYGEFLTMFNKI